MHALLGVEDQRPALIDASMGRVLSYRQLATAVRERADNLARYRGALVFLGAANTLATVVDYLALTSIGATVALLDPNASEAALEGWVHAYQPEALWGFPTAPSVSHNNCGSVTPPERDDAEEALLLATSGSTGNPKFVRLAARNIAANARQIAQALRIDTTDRTLAHLPLFYSYGLSVLNSHLVAGATVVLTTASALQPEFWDAMREHAVSSLPGVPYSYELYRRVGLLDMELPALRHMTQAGGRLAPELVQEFHAALSAHGAQLWIMYGQTEATARIAVLPSEELPAAAGSVGYALPNGSLTVADPDEHGVGELVYRGPNVMLGYACSRADLGCGDELGGVLRTGDLGRIDGNGRVWIEGRTRRIAKVFGTRVNLDDIESQLGAFGTVAALDTGDRVTVFVAGGDDVAALGRQMERALGFPPRSIVVHPVPQLPTTAAGKIDYQQLRATCVS